MSNHRDIVLFTGAGFSKNAGLPIMSEFGAFAKNEYESLYKKHYNVKRSSDAFRHSSPSLIEAAEVFMNFQDFCRQSNTLKNDDINNLETVFCIAEILNESNIEHITLNGNEYSISEVLNHIKIWLWKIYHICPLVNEDTFANAKEYQVFFNYLKEIDLLWRTSVITTNYDLVFEYMTWKNGIRCIYPINNNKYEKSLSLVNGASDKRYVQYFNEYRDINLEHVYDSYEIPNAPIIYKLHGSVNYFSKENDVNSLMISDDVSEGGRPGKPSVRNGVPAILSVNAIWDIMNKYGRSVVPMIIPPTYSKLTGHTWLRQIWNDAMHSLSTANKIIFIGYSIPESDGFMRAFLHGAMALRKNEQPPKVYIIDPKETTHLKFNEIFNDMIQDVQCQTFPEAINNGIIEKILKE